ncbi:hypothetical protein GQ600_20743 [Phytophthora cactorum]|nr:hypothetical protein GQ600_20743 [Phytophthora cactorum]
MLKNERISGNDISIAMKLVSSSTHCDRPEPHRVSGVTAFLGLLRKTSWNVSHHGVECVSFANTVVAQIQPCNECSLQAPPHSGQFVSTIARMYSSYARRKTRITRVPPDSDTDDDEKSAISLTSLRSETDDNLSLSDDLSSVMNWQMKRQRSLGAEIVMHANVYDFSLYWDRKQGSEASSGTEEERP